MKEQDIQKAITKYIEGLGGYVAKVVTASKAGVPDLVVCYQGRFYGLEVKTLTGRVAPIQTYNLKKIGEAGGVGVVVRSVADVREILVKP